MEAVCTSDGTFTCAAPVITSDLPTVIRHDNQTYMKQREGLPNLNHDSIIFPKKWYQYDENDIFSGSDIDPSSPQSCKIYMAESSIPNAGIGLFAGVDFEYDEYIDANPQIVIPIIDIYAHDTDRSYVKSLLHNYPWSAWTQGAHLESDSASIVYPNIGMMSNSHLGLTNIEQSMDSIVAERGSYDRSVDYGTGARSLYNALTFKAATYEGIERGSEIFSDYGESYFHDREEAFHMIFPTYSNYAEADKIVREFAETEMGIEIDGEDKDKDDNVDEITISEARKAWDNIIRELEEDESYEKTRIAFALPEKVEDIKYVAKVGTARYSIPDSIRSIDWLKEHGLCLGNLHIGKSNIPHAGNGAFAATKLAEGDMVAPVVLLPVFRKTFQMNGKGKGSQQQQQLLLNYSFGHPKSTLMFFPYSSGVHFINHSAEPNAMLQWSTSELHRHEYLEREVKDVGTGLIMEIIALTDIELGEEITIDYGIAWENAWYDHISSWERTYGKEEKTTTSESKSEESPNPNINPAVTAEELNKNININKPIRTVDEQPPYPPCIRTACYSSAHNGTYVFTNHDHQYLRFCNITDRIRNGDDYWYSARMESSEYYEEGSSENDDDSNDEVVTYIPRDAIKFVLGKYCSDMHVKNAFRHEIHVPDGIYPDIWLDLDKSNGGGNDAADDLVSKKDDNGEHIGGDDDDGSSHEDTDGE